MIQFIHNGDEYTTRTRLLEKYPIAHTSLQMLLYTREIPKLMEGNKSYFLKHATESIIEEYIQNK